MCIAVAGLVTTSAAHAAIVELTTRPATGDVIDWGQIGPPSTIFPTPQSFTSAGGITGMATLAQDGNGNVIEQCCIGLNGLWDGNFAPGDILFSTGSSGPLTLSFTTPLHAVGAQIASNFYGSFTAQIQAFDGAALLGTFSENGVETTSADGSAIFLRVQDTTADITSVI